MTKPNILIVEDDPALRETLRENLVDEGYEVATADGGAGMKKQLSEKTFDLLILDIMLPDGDGYQLCRDYRAAGGRAMVLVLTARTLEDDIVKGFEAGADDYLAKPYRLKELTARVKALLRRSESARFDQPEEVIAFAGYHLERAARQVIDPEGGLVELTRTEFDLLLYFAERKGEALTRDAILDQVWGEEVVVDHRTVDNFVSSLKKKLAWSPASGFRISTIRGVGYRFEVL